MEEHQAFFHRIWLQSSLYCSPQSYVPCEIPTRGQIRSEQIRLNWPVLNPSYSKNLKNWNCLAPYFAWTQRIETITSHLYWHDLVLFVSSLAWSYSSGLLPRQIVWLCNIGTTQRPINSSVESIDSLSPKILWTFRLKIITLLFPPMLDYGIMILKPYPILTKPTLLNLSQFERSTLNQISSSQ